MVGQTVTSVATLCLCATVVLARYTSRAPLTYERVSAQHARWLEQHGAALYQPGFGAHTVEEGMDSAAARARLGVAAGGGRMVAALNQVIRPGAAGAGTTRLGNDVQEYTVKVPSAFKMDPNYQYHIDELFGIETT